MLLEYGFTAAKDIYNITYGCKKGIKVTQYLQNNHMYINKYNKYDSLLILYKYNEAQNQYTLQLVQ